MKLEKELTKLKPLIGTNDEAFKEQLNSLYVNFPNDKEAISNFVEKEMKAAISEGGKKLETLTVRVQLLDNIDVLPLSYIAQNYFHKSRQWLYQRINGNLVNGKPAKLTETEIKTFNKALKDISKRIGSINIV